MRIHWDHEAWPWGWVLAVPLLTVPATFLLWHLWLFPQCAVELVGADRRATCPGASIAVALLPGFLNGLPLLWGFSAQARVRQAAWWAGGCGLLRWAVPLLLRQTYQPTVGLNSREAVIAALVSIGLWVATLGVLALFLRRASPPGGESPSL